MSTTVDNHSQKYSELEGAYRSAYTEADGFDDLNRALVNHYVARSSGAAANFLRTRGGDAELAGRAESFAKSAAELDNLSAGARLAKLLYRLLPAGFILAAGLAAITFLLTLLAEINQSGEALGKVVGLGLSGGLLFVVLRAAYYALQGAAAGGKFLAESLEKAIHSNSAAKRVLGMLAGPEQSLFAPAPIPTRAQVGRVIVKASGPLLAAILAIAIAIPVAMGASALAGVVSGVEKGVADDPFSDYTIPDYDYSFPESGE